MTLFSLIKKGKVLSPSGKKIIDAESFSEMIEAKELIENAKIEAVELLQKTEVDCLHLKKLAQEQGKELGLAKFSQHALFFDKKAKQLEIELQKLILPLALKAAKKIVSQELTLNPELIVHIVMKTLKPVTQSKIVRIYVSKHDKALIETKKHEIRKLLDQVQTLSIEERSDIENGGCIIETEAGIINATLENQWRALEAAFDMFKS